MAMDLKPLADQRLAPLLAQILTPKMLAMLKILHLPYQQLVDQIQEEAESNVFLEVERRDELLNYARYLAKSSSSRGGGMQSIETLPGVEEMEEQGESLADHLLKQLALEDLPDYKMAIGRELIAQLDEAGYITRYAEVRDRLAEEMDIDPRVINQVLKLIQTFEPDGVGARNLKESLLIQVWEYNFDNDALRDILERAIRYHLDDLAKKQYDKVAEGLGIGLEGVQTIETFIQKNLNPKPGYIFAGKRESMPVIPSFQVAFEEQEGSLFKVTNLEASYGPMLRISREYISILENPKTDEKTLNYLREKFESAQNFLENIVRRQQTIERIVHEIVSKQEGFLRKGVHWIAPLMQKDIAEKLSVHPSTVSRAIAQKYVQTPGGVFSLKFLCPRAYKGYTVPQVKALVADIIRQEEEKTEKPLSDLQIKAKLLEMGIQIERRTVAKYRKELHIPPSYFRKVTTHEVVPAASEKQAIAEVS